MRKVLIYVFATLGVVTSVDLILVEFFHIGTSQFQNYILLYLVIFLFENELKDFPRDILTEKLVKYPMYISVTLAILSRFAII